MAQIVALSSDILERVQASVALLSAFRVDLDKVR